MLINVKGHLISATHHPQGSYNAQAPVNRRALEALGLPIKPIRFQLDGDFAVGAKLSAKALPGVVCTAEMVSLSGRTDEMVQAQKNGAVIASHAAAVGARRGGHKHVRRH